jgi:hypothetical protein
MVWKRLTNTAGKIKDYPDLPKDVFAILLVTLVGAGAFMLGRISAREEARKDDLKIVQIESSVDAPSPASDKPAALYNKGEGSTTPAGSPSSSGMYVGSKSGTAYHLPWCSGALRIKEENKVWFASKQEAEAKGYRAAANCKGI